MGSFEARRRGVNFFRDLCQGHESDCFTKVTICPGNCYCVDVPRTCPRRTATPQSTVLVKQNIIVSLAKIVNHFRPSHRYSTISQIPESGPEYTPMDNSFLKFTTLRAFDNSHDKQCELVAAYNSKYFCLALELDL